MNLLKLIGLKKVAYLVYSLYVNGPLTKVQLAQTTNSSYARTLEEVKMLKWHRLLTDHKGADNRERRITLTDRGRDLAVIIESLMKICKEYDESDRRKRLKSESEREDNPQDSNIQ